VRLETFGQIPTALIIFGKLKQLHSNLGTILAIWAMGRVSFRFA